MTTKQREWDAINGIPKGQATTFNGKRYRMCVYPTTDGWAGFVEDARWCLGFTGPCPSRRIALVEAARIILVDQHDWIST